MVTRGPCLMLGWLLLCHLACPVASERSQRPTPPLPVKKPDAKGNSAPEPAASTTHRFAIDPQPLFRGVPARTGRAAGPIPKLAPSILWRFATGRPLFASPILDATGTTYLGSLDGFVYAIDLKGQLRWRHRLGDRIYASAALVPEGLVVGADDDRVRLLDRSGTLRWSYILGRCASVPRGEGRGPESVRCDADSSPVITPDGTIVLGGDALYALGQDGRLRWRLETGGHVRSSPALGPDGSLYVGVQGGAVIAVSASGQKRWEHRELYDFDSTPALSPGGLVVIGCDDGRLYGLRASDGAVQLRVATRGPVRGSPALAPDGTILFGSDDGLLRAVTPAGALRWSFATGGAIRSSPALDEQGTSLFGSEDDSLYALDSAGKLLWKLELGGDVDSSPALTPDGTILVGADDGVLYALGQVR